MTSVAQENRWKRTVKETLYRRSDALRNQEAAFMDRKARPAVTPPLENHSRMQVRAWMRRNACEYENATCLAEAANAALRLPFGAMDDDAHWVWEESLSAIDMEQQ